MGGGRCGGLLAACRGERLSRTAAGAGLLGEHRFQCAGCGWYQPDPSYLPAVEDHIRTLKTQRELGAASDTDSWVIANMSSEIDAFAKVAARMREHLSAMPADEREQIEQASAVLRRTRAGTPRALLPLTVIHSDPPADAR